jgi:3-deoxy-manno-octulosonate cytidylyltransferase (CMP-KDO synthetase)
MSGETVIVVPARLGSQRFPAKLLHPVCGKPLIAWTARNLESISPGLEIVFAVAEEELAEVVAAMGFRYVMTEAQLPSGTDRIAAANRELGATRIINVQADEPLLERSHLEQLQQLMESGAEMATLATPFTSVQDFADPNKVKVVRANNGTALYFSRASIPFQRDQPGNPSSQAFWHLGLYAYTAEVLEAFTQWPPAALEQIEKLEQLRLLENGHTINVGITHQRTVGVDTPEDLKVLTAELNRRSSPAT